MRNRIAKGFAEFYTKVPIAHLLAYLSLLAPNPSWRVNWRDPESLRANFRICDFACGTGVLLSAAYAGLCALCTESDESEGDGPCPADLQKALVEDCIWGFDASEEAVSLASRALRLLALGASPRRVNIHHLPVDGSGSLGSLSLWRGGGRSLEALPLFDLVIMNPPYSRTTAPGAAGSRPRIFDYSESAEDFERLWREYKALIRDLEEQLRRDERIAQLYREHVGTGRAFLPRNVDPLRAGASLPFVVLADRYLKPGGRLALVLPRSAMGSSSYFLLRALLAARYLVEFIVVCAKEGDSSFSERTQMSEILLVARKNPDGVLSSHQELRVVVLRRQPRTKEEATQLAKEILRAKPMLKASRLVRAGSAEAEVRATRQASVERLVWNWAPIAGLPPKITMFIERMLQRELPGVSVRLRRLLEFPGVRITNPRLFRAERFSSRFAYSRSGELRILNRTGRSVMRRLLLDLERTGRLLALSPDSSKYYAEMGGRLLVPEAIRFSTTPLVSTWSPEVIASSRAHMLSAQPDLERALCVWLNSTFAIAWLRSMFTTLERGFGHIYGWHIRTLPVPDLTDAGVVGELNSVFERYSSLDWAPLLEQFKGALRGKSSARLGFDLDVLRALSSSQGEDLNEGEIRRRLSVLYSGVVAVL